MVEILAAYPNPHQFVIKGDQLHDLLSTGYSATSSPTSPVNPIHNIEHQFDIDCRNGVAAGVNVNIRSVVLIDSRNMFQFNESHVRESVNVSRCPLFEKRIRDGKLHIVEYLESRVSFGSNQDIVIYDDNQNTQDFSEFTRLIYDNLWKVLQKTAEQVRLHILEGGYDAFRLQYPEHCTNGVPFVHRFMGPTTADDESGFLNFEATEITPNIFIGGLHDASSDELLTKLGITHIINCSRTPYKRDPKYKYLPLECADDLKQSLAEKLQPAFDMIDETKRDGGKVLVHCYAGISRSAAIVIAYLMQFHSWTYDHCYAHVKSKRKIIAPNINFVGQLMRFETTLVIKPKGQQFDEQEEMITDETDCAQSSNQTKSALSAEVKVKPVTLLSPVVEDESSSREQVNGEDCAMKKSQQQPPAPAFLTLKPLNKAPTSKFMQRKQLSGLCVKLPAARPGFRYDDIASAPILPSGYNPFAEAFKNANAAQNAAAACKGKSCSPP
jgi:dual specificity MAP kinase phosphatase